MTAPAADYDEGLRLFERQIYCIIHDERKSQMEIYTEDLQYEFPFATDRPRLIRGRESFRAVMTPLWQEARKKGVNVTGCSREFHTTDEPGLFLAVFTLDGAAGDRTFSLPFVQLIRVRGGKIAEVREYFNPQARGEL